MTENSLEKIPTTFPIEVNDHSFEKARETEHGFLVRCTRCNITLFFPTNDELLLKQGIKRPPNWFEETLKRFPACTSTFIRPSVDLQEERSKRTCCGGNRNG